MDATHHDDVQACVVDLTNAAAPPGTRCLYLDHGGKQIEVRIESEAWLEEDGAKVRITGGVIVAVNRLRFPHVQRRRQQ